MGLGSLVMHDVYHGFHSTFMLPWTILKKYKAKFRLVCLIEVSFNGISQWFKFPTKGQTPTVPPSWRKWFRCIKQSKEHLKRVPIAQDLYSPWTSNIAKRTNRHPTAPSGLGLPLPHLECSQELRGCYQQDWLVASNDPSWSKAIEGLALDYPMFESTLFITSLALWCNTLLLRGNGDLALPHPWGVQWQLSYNKT